MWCPKCNYEDTKVIDTRVTFDHSAIRRRRKCLQCGHRFSTIETYSKSATIVVKRSGKEEEFDAEKIISSLKKAIKHDEFLEQKLETLTTEIIAQLESTNLKKIESNLIGKAVMDKLKVIDPIAYLRYASIYKNFNSTHQFEEEFKCLRSDE